MTFLEPCCRMCFALSEAAVSFSQNGSVDLTLMLPDGAKIHFKAAGNELSQVNNDQAENPSMACNSSVENAMAQIKQFLAENPEIGQLSAKKQKNIYDREKKRKMPKFMERYPVFGLAAFIAAVVIVLLSIRGWEAYKDYLTKDGRFTVEDYVVKVRDEESGVDTPKNTYRNSKKRYKVYYEYTVDGITQSYIKRNQTYPFSTTTHYFYRDENGTAVEAHFITTWGMITSGGLVILCIFVGFVDIIQCKKRRKN